MRPKEYQSRCKGRVHFWDVMTPERETPPPGTAWEARRCTTCGTTAHILVSIHTGQDLTRAKYDWPEGYRKQRDDPPMSKADWRATFIRWQIDKKKDK